MATHGQRMGASADQWPTNEPQREELRATSAHPRTLLRYFPRVVEDDGGACSSDPRSSRRRSDRKENRRSWLRSKSSLTLYKVKCIERSEASPPQATPGRAAGGSPTHRPVCGGRNHEAKWGTADFYNERPRQKLLRKIKQEPLVPLGIGLTVLAFVNAYRALRRGDSRQANRMFRARVAAQGFTVIAMVAGSMYYSQDREKTKELRKLKEERDAEEKRQRWIRELEVRDEEDKHMRAALERRRHGTTTTTTATPPVDADAETASVDRYGEGAEGAAAQGTGGILGKMGLWSKGQDSAKAAEPDAAEQVAAVVVGGGGEVATNDHQDGDRRGRRENPKSSLGAIGEVLSKEKKEDDPKK
ncbi:mitochondrial hypoxia responsive domain-containing protein [Moelleriella libera RCEF 2490]|uniref:Mitochondrial hypoxia responsive domain-containing protein n=1 Tax=Moelleriella libera RCEF 2490 TaxID=1081109 RepID=A0A167XKV8_9HYPO|nr:mitochondrial hypoxia responsive domain-containing protein [Moelleriella libera RCEF 2490]